MTRLTIPYSILIITFGLFLTLMILASPHHVGKDLMTISLVSLLIFILTGYFLHRSFSVQKNTPLTITLLFLTAIIFGYYTYDMFKKQSGFSWLDIWVITAFTLTLLFILSLFQKRHLTIKEDRIENWEDYWALFNRLCSSLNDDNKQLVVADMKDAQKHVNGLTDGWHEFLEEFKKVKEVHHRSFSPEQNNLASTLIRKLEKSLSNR